MKIVRQIAAITAMNFRNLPGRFWPSMVIVVGMACVIGVLVSMLSLAVGYMHSQSNAGDPGRAIVLSTGGDYETQSSIPRASVGPITDMPGIAKDPDGVPIADPEILTYVRASQKDTGTVHLIIVRGMGRKGLTLRPELKLAAGRMFRPGAHEMIVGIAADRQMLHFDIGDDVPMPDGKWRIVGTFTTGGDTLEGEILADADTLLGTLRRKNYNSVIVRLAAPTAFEDLRRALAGNPGMAVTAERHSDYYLRLAGQYSVFFDAIAYAVGGIMALGALFGAVNTMYSAVNARTREIGTLRALGFGGFAVAVSVIAEALALALAGALAGAMIAWVMFNGRQYAFSDSLFDLSVTPGLIGLGIGWAAVITFLGALFPAIRAARLPIVDALRAT